MFGDFIQAQPLPFLAMDWMAHLRVLHWLPETLRNKEVSKELLIAAVTRWSLTGLEHIEAKGLVLIAKDLPGLGVGIFKSEKLLQPTKIKIFKMANELPNSETSYALVHDLSNLHDLKWLPVFD